MVEKRLVDENAEQVLKARYYLRDDNDAIVEDARGMFRRVAKAIAEGDRLHGVREDDILVHEQDYFDVMALRKFEPNSPTLMNAGTGAGTLSACFVLPLEDSMAGIMKCATDVAMVQKFGGGTGVALSRLRPKGAAIRTTHGRACGPVAVLKHLSSVSTMITQGGKRDGANMAVMDVHHPDILEFIDCKKVEGEIHNYNVSVGVDDEFMRAVENGGPLELRDPQTGTVVATLDARDVFQKIVEGAWRNGEPGMVSLDAVNRDNPLLELYGRIEASNPCGEEPLLPYDSCNIGSINLGQFVKDGDVDWTELEHVAEIGTRFLDNVITVNRYSVPEIEERTKATRRIGLGVMGFADMLFKLRVPYDSTEATELGRGVMRFIRGVADRTSLRLAEERGPYGAWEEMPPHVQAQTPRYRNAWRMTVAPTGTVSMIAGCSSGIEPLFALVFRKSNILGTKGQAAQSLYYLNEEFERVAKERGFYSDDLMEHLAGGKSLQVRKDVPEDVKRVFKTAHDVSPEAHVRMQAAFQASVDAGISKTINFPHDATVEDVRTAYVLAWRANCKGITVYRAGSREKEVLTVGKGEKKSVEGRTPQPVAPKERPTLLTGMTQRVVTGHGNLYVTVNFDPQTGQPFELFAQQGKAGGCDHAQMEAVMRLCSLALRSGVSPKEIISQLQGITCCLVWDNGEQVRSGPDAVAKVLKGIIEAEEDAKNPPDPTREHRVAFITERAGPQCPACNAAVIFQEGCSRCSSCNWNKCG